MTSLDARLGPAVISVIEKVGKVVTFHVEARTYDPNTGQTTVVSSEDHTVKVTPPSGFHVRFVDGDTVQSGDLQFLLAGKDVPFTPEPEIRVTLDEEIWTVVGVTPVYSGEDVAAYRLQLRR